MTDDGYKGAAALLVLAWLPIEPFIIMALWRWYVVPFDILALTWPHAFGLNLLVNLIVWRYLGERDPEDRLRGGIETIGAGILAFALGWIAHFWM